jgi:hypothetical protein
VQNYKKEMRYRNLIQGKTLCSVKKHLKHSFSIEKLMLIPKKNRLSGEIGIVKIIRNFYYKIRVFFQ